MGKMWKLPPWESGKYEKVPANFRQISPDNSQVAIIK